MPVSVSERYVNRDLATMERFLAHGVAADGFCRMQSCGERWPCSTHRHDEQYIGTHIIDFVQPYQSPNPVNVEFRHSPDRRPTPFRRDYRTG